METVVVARVVMERAAAVAAGVAFAEVVGLHQGTIASKPFPINLVQVVGLHHRTTDNPRSCSSLDGELDSAEHDVPVGLDQRPVTLLGDGEGRAIGAVVGDVSNRCEIWIGTRGEVKRLGLSKSRVRRTSWDGSATDPAVATP